MRSIATARRGRLTLVALVIATVLLIPAPAPSSATSGRAFVRVNQIGYAIPASKRAYLMSTGSESGATFAVKNGGSILFSDSVGADLGSWSSTYPHVYALDFGSFTTAGTYTIEVTGPIAATSPTFGIHSGANLYADALTNSLGFYQNERDGANFIPSALRHHPSHLNDAHAMTYRRPSSHRRGLSPLGLRIDASGGWWDAGDYLKFVQTTSYTVDLLLAGVRDFPAQMGSGSSSSDFTAEGKFGTRFLLRMWDDRTSTLYYQVGIGSGRAGTVGDHDIWRLPQRDDTFGGTGPRFRFIRHRPVFRAGPAGARVSPNLAGRLAAAFAECYQVYRASDPAFADRCITAAEHIYALADTTPDTLLTVIPFGFYPEREWQSDMELGATELYFAAASGGLPPGLPHTDPSFYLQKGAHWANAYMASRFDANDTLNLYDVSGLAHDHLYRAITQAGNPGGLETTQAALLDDMKKALDGALTQAATDPFEFGFPWDVWDTTSHGAGLSVMASEYDELSGTTTYADWSGRWLGNILGANAWGTSLIVGDGTTFPHCMQHQVTNIVGSLNGSPPILAGAVVEGPNGTLYHGSLTHMRPCPPSGVDRFARFDGGSGAKFKDNVESFSTVEPAIDLTASSPLAFARQMAGLR
jgi:endoglucanase